MADLKGNNQQLGVPLGIYKDRYMKLDPDEASRRTGVPFHIERGAFALTVLGYQLYAAWPDYTLVPGDPAQCPRELYNGEALILLIRYLLEGAHAEATGNWLPYRDLPWGDVYDQNFQGRCIKRLAFGFGSKLDVFAKACDKLSGVRHNKGDACYDLPFLPGVTVRLILWAGDEEFPPQSQWLFSDNTPLAFTAEDVAVIGDVIIGALKEMGN